MDEEIFGWPVCYWLASFFDACVDWEWSLNIFVCQVIVFLPSCLVKTFALFENNLKQIHVCII